MYKKKNMKGGNSTSHSSEYYGVDSGNYFTNPPVTGGSAYGNIVPVSHGVIRGDVSGPNLAVYPGEGLIQTGGASCGAHRKTHTGGAGCGAHRKTHTGGAGCGGNRKPLYGGAGCPYNSSRQKGGEYKKKRSSKKKRHSMKKRSSNKKRNSRRRK